MDALAATDLKRNDLRESIARIDIETAKQEKKFQDEKNKAKEQEIELQNEIVALRKQEAAEAKKAAEARASQEKRVGAAQGNLDTFKKDRASMSLQELAAISPFAVGVDAATSESAAKARDILGLESEAEKRRKSGDVAGAGELFSRADDMRNAIAGGAGVKSTEQSAAAKLEAALAAELTELKEINAKFAGVAKTK
jgi:hypothetical protein